MQQAEFRIASAVSAGVILCDFYCMFSTFSILGFSVLAKSKIEEIGRRKIA